ncbi:hypothetical protein HPB48_010995 [Haemaphysalis longicornis]|uniref:Uncharacterized protein n=1 Tax=Haemaphysalis longicornis TaxID=44386 RepID=A0A9J6FXS8_HAELO|nr:hypothetical protein HPB48_010995 [Haemaphysalis longicornis]
MSGSASSPQQAAAAQELYKPVQPHDASSHYPTMSQAPDATMQVQSNEQNQEDSAMQTDSTKESGSPVKWARDENSGRTIDLKNQWKVTQRKRNKTAATQRAPPAAQPTSQPSASETAQRRRSQMPPLPVDDTKIIYHPQAGLQLSKWSLAEITNAIGRASKIMQKESYDNLRIQVQRIENLVIASTPRKILHFDFLGEISSIQLGRDILTARAHAETPEWISRGVINGIPPNTSPGELMDGLFMPERYMIVAARMLGKSSAAVIYFSGRTRTNPDLTFTHGIHPAEWTRLGEKLGSDHHILQLQISHRKRNIRSGTAQITDWKAFHTDLNPANIEAIDKWLSKTLENAEEHTKIIQLNTDIPGVDRHLSYLWEARSLLKRWKRQKHNRKRKLNVATITKKAKEYGTVLSRQNWDKACDQLQGTLSKKTPGLSYEAYWRLPGQKFSKSKTAKKSSIHKQAPNKTY